MTALKKWHEVDGVYTRDEWEIPESGADVWCTAWKRGQLVKPYGDGAHIIVGLTVYHCDEFMGILDKNTADGYEWGIETPRRRYQQIDGYWREVTK